MSREKIDAQKIEWDPEKEAGRLPEQELKDLEDNNAEEESSLNEIAERIESEDPNFLQENIKNGILSSLGEKIKKNKLLRAALVGLSLYSANPVFASGLEEVLNKSETVDSARLSEKKGSDKNQFINLPESSQKHFEQIFSSASEEVKKIMLNELENGKGLSENDFLDGNSNEDLDLLILRNKIIDGQNKGEFESNGKNNRLSIENASEKQIRNWVDFLKDPEKFKTKEADWHGKNKEGWQNIYPKRNPEGQKYKNKKYDNIENY